eukprot:CAMPEP_0170095370 /NCGR_PEP_ID=MMETSP0019_2-20121128/27893_1 /TAXON_ID=98059 /ORGANISM="Dinobryon sp., Strain UTEXLB2267" /LENGTH=232 /DNA_ID=CAMNT_0010317043 /DNA_START=342 /DNA_END=1041 /DNA_ORIENTATION=-
MSEYIPGGELFSHLRRAERFEMSIYQFFAVEVACAIHHLHQLNIVIRDIKPENILLNRSGHIRLADLSFAKIIADSGRTFTLLGTTEYLSPEVIEGKGYGLASDWWSLGILVYEMSVGSGGQGELARVAGEQHQGIHSGAAGGGENRAMGCGRAGFNEVMTHSFFKGIEWQSAFNECVLPPLIPHLSQTPGDSSNYDSYPDEQADEASNLTQAERELFRQLDALLERPVRLT